MKRLSSAKDIVSGSEDSQELGEILTKHVPVKGLLCKIHKSALTSQKYDNKTQAINGPMVCMEILPKKN